METSVLPAAFTDLEPYLAWALPTENERTYRRKTSEMQDIRDFWEAMAPKLPEVMEYLDRYHESELTEDGKRLFYLALAMMEIAPAVENYGEPNVPLSADFRRWHTFQ